MKGSRRQGTWAEVAANIFARGLALAAVLVVAACAGSGERSPGGATYKVGEPYTVNGVRYVPREDPNYNATGIASWYGRDFHGKRTANGETYNMNNLTAAHPTLPLPSLVRVTNLENGRQVVLRVNDRGPFARGRIIDVSRRAAERLGFERQGTAKVRVQYAGRPDLDVRYADKAPAVTKPRPETPATKTASQSGGTGLPLAMASVAILPPPANADAETADDGVAVVPVSKAPDIFIQTGVFADPQNASRMRASLEALAPVTVKAETIDSRQLYRVRVGPFAQVAEADAMLSKLAEQGLKDALIVIE